MREQILNRFKENHGTFMGRVAEHAAPLGAQLVMAGQQAEMEAYAEIFGEAYITIYKGIVGSIIKLEFLEQVRAEIQGTDLNDIVEEFKKGFQEILLNLRELPFLEVLSITTEALRIEGKLAQELSGIKELHFEVAFWPIDREKGQFVAPGGWSILGFTPIGDGQVIGFREID